MSEKTNTGEAGIPQKISFLRQKLGQKAKQEPKFRFYSLYGQVLREDVLRLAFKKVKENRGSPGMDGVTVEDIEKQKGVEGFIQELSQELKQKRYRPLPVKRVYIPKPDGRKRPLGIPCIRDRVVQMAVLLILEPIFEADFLECSHGFRRGRSAHDALAEIRKYLAWGYTAVYDADLKGYFDSIPHDKLLKCLEMRISDRSLLKLIRGWLKTVIVEPGPDGGKQKWSRAKAGTPQGGVISPLLANIYLHWFDVAFHRKSGPYHWAKAKLVRYADDFVILAKYKGDRLKKFVEEKIESWLELKLNKEKTRIVTMRGPDDKLDFLGYQFYFTEGNTRKKYLLVKPSPKSLRRIREQICEMTGRDHRNIPVRELIGRINQMIRGWGAYFSRGQTSKAFANVNFYVGYRLYNNLSRRSQKWYNFPKDKTSYEYFKQLGLITLTKRMFGKSASP